MSGELLPRGDEPLSGEFLGKAGVGTHNDAHASEDAIKPLHDPRWTEDQLSPEWVISRLMREATDHGSRTRQSSRVAALKVLADIQGLTDKKEPGEEKSLVQRALDELPKEERQDLIRQKLERLGFKVVPK